MTDIGSRIWENVDKIREARHISKQGLADAMGVARSAIYKPDTTPSLDKLERVCMALGCDLSDLVKDIVHPESYEIPRGIEGTYPYNLARVIQRSFFPFENAEEFLDRTSGLDLHHAVEDLEGRSSDVIMLRFKSLLTLEDTGRYLGFTRERARQIEAKGIRRLASTDCRKRWYMVPLQEYLDASSERDALKRKIASLEIQLGEIPSVEDLKIEVLDLSIRSYNCLRRSGINTLQDLKKLTKADLMGLRNLGKKSCDEIIERSKEYGIEWK